MILTKYSDGVSRRDHLCQKDTETPIVTVMLVVVRARKGPLRGLHFKESYFMVRPFIAFCRNLLDFMTEIFGTHVVGKVIVTRQITVLAARLSFIRDTDAGAILEIKYYRVLFCQYVGDYLTDIFGFTSSHTSNFLFMLMAMLLLVAVLRIDVRV